MNNYGISQELKEFGIKFKILVLPQIKIFNAVIFQRSRMKEK